MLCRNPFQPALNTTGRSTAIAPMPTRSPPSARQTREPFHAVPPFGAHANCGIIGADVQAELEGEDAMKRPPAKKQTTPPASTAKPSSWSIYHIKGTPAAFLGRVEAPDEESAIRKAIEEFEINPALQKRLLAQRRT